MRSLPVLASWQRWVAAAVCAWGLAACAVPEWQKTGTSAAHIAQTMGQPQVRVPLADGGERWVYSRQPAGQQVYHMVMDSQQRLLRVDQVLQAPHFARLRPGVDTQDTVWTYFGKPAWIDSVASFHGDIWNYRFNEHNIDRLAHVFLDPQGVVQRVMFTDELRNEPDDRR